MEIDANTRSVETQYLEKIRELIDNLTRKLFEFSKLENMVVKLIVYFRNKEYLI